MSLGTDTEVLGQRSDLFKGFVVGFQQPFYLFNGIQDRRMVPSTEQSADFRKGKRAMFADQIHGDLPGSGQRSFAAGADQFVVGKTKGGGG